MSSLGRNATMTTPCVATGTARRGRRGATKTLIEYEGGVAGERSRQDVSVARTARASERRSRDGGARVVGTARRSASARAQAAMRRKRSIAQEHSTATAMAAMKLPAEHRDGNRVGAAGRPAGATHGRELAAIETGRCMRGRDVCAWERGPQRWSPKQRIESGRRTGRGEAERSRKRAVALAEDGVRQRRSARFSAGQRAEARSRGLQRRRRGRSATRQARAREDANERGRICWYVTKGRSTTVQEDEEQRGDASGRNSRFNVSRVIGRGQRVCSRTLRRRAGLTTL